MRALVKATPGPGLEMVERPIPAIRPDEVLIRVMRTGICGTDLHIHRWDDWAQRELHTPLIPGHEFSGDVVEIGANVHDIAVGDLVSGEGHIVCGTCRNCRAGRRQMCIRTIGLGLHRDGAFAEFVALPASNVWVHQFAVDPDLAAIFDPLGNAVHTALAFPLVGEDVLVTGCGPIGLMSVALARFVGARHVVATDVSEPRLLRARELGADDTVDVSSHSIHEAQERLGMREGFDVGFEMSGAATALSEMIDNMNHGGRIAILGLPTDVFPIDWAKVVTHMLTISGIYGRQMFETWNAMGAMLQTSAKLRADIGSIITDRFPRDAWAEAFAVAGSSTTGKVIIDWTE